MRLGRKGAQGRNNEQREREKYFFFLSCIFAGARLSLWFSSAHAVQSERVDLLSFGWVLAIGASLDILRFVVRWTDGLSDHIFPLHGWILFLRRLISLESTGCDLSAWVTSVSWCRLRGTPPVSVFGFTTSSILYLRFLLSQSFFEESEYGNAHPASPSNTRRCPAVHSTLNCPRCDTFTTTHRVHRCSGFRTAKPRSYGRKSAVRELLYTRHRRRQRGLRLRDQTTSQDHGFSCFTN